MNSVRVKVAFIIIGFFVVNIIFIAGNYLLDQKLKSLDAGRVPLLELLTKNTQLRLDLFNLGQHKPESPAFAIKRLEIAREIEQFEKRTNNYFKNVSRSFPFLSNRYMRLIQIKGAQLSNVSDSFRTNALNSSAILKQALSSIPETQQIEVYLSHVISLFTWEINNKAGLKDHLFYVSILINGIGVLLLLWIMQQVIMLSDRLTTSLRVTKEAQISEQKRAQEIAESNHFIDNIIGSMIETLIVIDSKGYVKKVNRSALELLNFKEEDLLKKSLTHILPNHAENPKYLIDKTVKHSFVKDEKVTFKTSCGQEIPMSLSGSVIKNVNNKIMGIVFVSKDMRQYYRLMEETKKSAEMETFAKVAKQEKAKMMSLVSGMKDGLIMLDDQGEIVLHNHSFNRILKLNTDEDMSTILPLLIKHLTFNPVVVLKGKEKLFVSKEVKIHKTPYQVVCTKVRGNNQTHIGTVITLRDMTEEKEVDRMKSEFLSIVSHELMTPLTVINCASSMLEEEHQLSDDDKTKHLLGLTKKNTHKLMDIIGNLLDTSQLESEMMEFRHEYVGLYPLVNSFLECQERKAKAKNITIVNETSQDLPQLFVDTKGIKQVFDHLLDNAIKFTPDGGKVVIQAQKQDEKNVIISVSDNGIGIPSKDQEKIFDKFKQAEHYMTRKSGGIGLGLPLVKLIVEAHEGKIWVKSEENKGTRFTFTLPTHKHNLRTAQNN